MTTTDLIEPAQAPVASPGLPPIGEPDVRGRVRAEYLEMPGMALTPRQAAHLWSLPLASAAELLTHLVNSGFLIQTDDNRYRRPGCPRCT